MAKPTVTTDSLKRLGGGRWQTRDERFTIEPQSGTWVVVDAEQTDDLGLPLVRGPFGSLTAAKDAIAGAREAAPAVSPLAARVGGLRDRPPLTTSAKRQPAAGRPAAPTPPAEPEPPPEPRWLRDLERTERARARRLIAALTAAGARDPEGIVRRDVVGRVPAAAAFAIARAVKALGPGASPEDVARLLGEGSDPDLGVRWRLVDGDGRPIALDLAARGS